MSKRICACIPLYGDSDAAGLPKAFAGTLYMLATQLDVICQDEGWDRGSIELDPTPYPDSIEHARNNLVRLFLAHPRSYTHLLFWDADVKSTPQAIAQVLGAMLKADVPIVGAPYVQKAHFWRSASRAVLEYLQEHPKASEEEVEHVLRGWSVRYVPDPRVLRMGERSGDLVEMDHAPLGFGLIRRDVLEKMTEYYRAELGYDRQGTDPKARDVYGGELEHHVGLFHTVLERGKFLMEDVAFAERWRAMGGRQYLYVGQGTPLEHVGRTSFGGTREALLADWRGR